MPLLRDRPTETQGILGVRFPENQLGYMDDTRMWAFFLHLILRLEPDIVWHRGGDRKRLMRTQFVTKLMRTQVVKRFVFHKIVTQACCCANLGHLGSTPAPFVSGLIGAELCWFCWMGSRCCTSPTGLLSKVRFHTQFIDDLKLKSK